MDKIKLIEQINQQIKNLLSNNPTEDFENNLKAVLNALFSKLDLVTREEFDIQQQVLIKTRMKLEELELKMKQIDK